MNQPNLAVTDVTGLIADLEAGTYERRISVALSQVAAAVVDSEKNGKVTLELKLTPIKGTQQVAVAHSISYEKPLARGKSTESDTGETVLHVGRAGKLTLSQPDIPGMPSARQTSLA